MVATAKSTSLIRGIHRWDLVCFGINFIIGAGVFGLPSQVFNRAGSWSIPAYLICSTGVLLIVLCFAEASSRFTQSGGPYTFAREAFGPIIGFEAGWLRWLAGIASFAANSNLLLDYLSYVAPPVNKGVYRVIILLLITSIFATANIIGVRDTARVSNFFAIGKLVPLILFVIVGVFFINPANFSSAVPPDYASFSMAVLLLVYAFVGFESLPIPAGETTQPRRNVPFALLMTIGFVTVLYVAVQAVCIGTLPTLGTSSRPLTDAASLFLGVSGGLAITVGAILSISGNLNAQVLATSRMLFAMGEQEQLPKSFARLHPGFRTPFVSVLACAVLMLALALSGTFVQLATISVISRLGMYAATCAAVPVLRRRKELEEASFKLRLGPMIPILGVGMCVWLASNATRREALTTLIVAVVGLIILLANMMIKRRRR